jgi:glycosyltransferase involved in cell wall biosynthesis
VRVLLHADAVGHAIPGGIGAYTRSLVTALSGRVDVELLVSRSAGPLPWELPVRRSALPLRPLYASWTAVRLPRTARGAGVVHATNLVLPPGGRRLVVTVHDLNVELYPALVPQPWRSLYRRSLRQAVRRADVLLTSTRAVGEALQERFGVAADRLALTPFGPGLAHGAPRDDAALARLGVRAPYVLSVGTLEPRKDQVTLVRAFAAAGLADHTLVLAGARGWGAEAVERAAGDRVVLTGAVPPEVLASLYAGADAFALPSRYEGFGLPALEALAHGVPTVVSADPALAEVTGGAALVVPVGDVEALADALRSLVSDAVLRSRLAAAGPQRAAAFSWDRTAEATAEAYRRAAA